ncbi:probable phosphoglycerate mutase [Butyrivibrio sp. ob235]|uniref:histidine phosphatase family protein n=1 Tax=Butyrivibrio sp. ob235 TaxID=1761780 RepID=UPI0008B04DD5|nr:histidine phosphatase family protein [Butyrivibrio sp. ob235]SEK71693.1 probable phosphoglycerate mutase [Butyrivibrio sp. ob235]
MKIFILRHGTTAWNNKRLIQGQTDIPLDELGKLMATETGKGLKAAGVSFDKVYSSPLSRSYETAEIVLRELCGSNGDSCTTSSECHLNESQNTFNITTDDRLKELHFGFMDGGSVFEMTEDEHCPFRYFKTAPDLYEKEILAWRNSNNTEDKTANPELLSELCLRAKDFMINVIEPMANSSANANNTSASESDSASCDSTVLISAHGALSKAILMYVRGESDLAKFWGDGLLPNCGIAVVELTFDARKPIYKILNSSVVYYDESIQDKAPKLL